MNHKHDVKGDNYKFALGLRLAMFRPEIVEVIMWAAPCLEVEALSSKKGWGCLH